MAVLKGIKEKAHLPLYDSLFVRPRKQLREVESSSVIKFFVNLQGKTKVETNMQSASLLPHWNTFEARAMRVVISDLPPKFPPEIENCLRIEDDNNGRCKFPSHGSQHGEAPVSIDGNGAESAPQIFKKARERIAAFKAALTETEVAPPDLDQCQALLRAFCDSKKLGGMLQLHRNLRLLRSDLAAVIRRSKAKMLKLEALNRFADELEAMSEAADDSRFIKQLDQANACLDAIEMELAFARRARNVSFADVQSLLAMAERPVFTAHPRPDRPPPDLPPDPSPVYPAAERIPGRLPDQVLLCLKQRVRDEFRFPLAAQVFGDGVELFARLIFNSVTTFFAGEKVMIQMPTWFFPAGAGPYSGNGRAVSHGFPAPEATFCFAEPVFIDAQQNFRVEIEIPEAGALSELQRIYGPFFIWVVLDGYLQRDVQ